MIKWLIIFMLICSPCLAGVDFTNVDDFDYIKATDPQPTNVTMYALILPDVDNAIFFTKEGIYPTNVQYYNLYINASTQTLRAQVHVGGSYYTISGSTDIVDGSPHYVGLTYDGETLHVYVDGVSENNDGTMSGNMTTSSGLVMLGLLVEARNDYAYQGIIYEAALWSTALTADEMLLLATSDVKRLPLQIQPSSLEAYFPLDDYGDGTALNTDVGGYKDLSVNANHGQGVDADTDSLNIAETVLSYP